MQSALRRSLPLRPPLIRGFQATRQSGSVRLHGLYRPFRLNVQSYSPARAYSPLSKSAAEQSSSHNIVHDVSSQTLRDKVFRRPSQPPLPSINDPTLSMTKKLSLLFKKYGWAAGGIYVILSILDFTASFVAIRALGPETIGKYEHKAILWIKDMTGLDLRKGRAKEDDGEEGEDKDDSTSGVEKRTSSASLWTELVLAYGVHKLLIFVRAPLTFGITPPVVRRLRKMGWNIGRQP